MSEGAGVLGTILGTGPGRGIGLMFVLSGVFAVGTALVAWNHPLIRRLEADIPDFDAAPRAALNSPPTRAEKPGATH